MQARAGKTQELQQEGHRRRCLVKSVLGAVDVAMGEGELRERGRRGRVMRHELIGRAG